MSVVVATIRPKPRDLGDGFVVRRALPALEARNVGPFIFLDEMGPTRFPPGQGLDVRAHPHIGLATVTYLFEGAIEHRDSLGTVQTIRPGDVNRMTAGRGIVHSERSPKPRDGATLHGIQFWVALPREDEDIAPAFHHHPAATLPRWTEGGAAAILIAGTYQGRTAPAAGFSPMVYLDLALEAGARFALHPVQDERALYVVEGGVAVDGTALEPGVLALLAQGQTATLTADAPARLIAFGGAPLDAPRKLWWNFVSSRPERIAEARTAWEAGEMAMPPGEIEPIPAPPLA
jgi:redox-sensitive bicupin YhaK (pirin superfamily)